MSFKPKVSIVIPVYNGLNYMREAIDSALAQTYKNIETIVINDGSTDDGKTDEIAKSYGDKIRYYHKENGGVATALNMGIEQMTGDYFSWLSHDDVYYPNKVERQIQYLSEKENRDVMLFCASEIIDENSKKIKLSRIKPNLLKHKYISVLSTCIGGCSLLVPRICFEKVGNFNKDLKTTQDIEMWLRIAKAGFDFKYMPDVLIKSRRHMEQESIAMEKEHKKNVETFYIWALGFIREEAISLYDDLKNILIKKKYYKTLNSLIKIKYENNLYMRYKSMLLNRIMLILIQIKKKISRLRGVVSS